MGQLSLAVSNDSFGDRFEFLAAGSFGGDARDGQQEQEHDCCPGSVVGAGNRVLVDFHGRFLVRWGTADGENYIIPDGHRLGNGPSEAPLFVWFRSERVTFDCGPTMTRFWPDWNSILVSFGGVAGDFLGAVPSCPCCRLGVSSFRFGECSGVSGDESWLRVCVVSNYLEMIYVFCWKMGCKRLGSVCGGARKSRGRIDRRGLGEGTRMGEWLRRRA